MFTPTITNSNADITITVVDIGSNSIRSQNATLRSGSISFSPKEIYTTRLADGLKLTGRLSQIAMDRSMKAIEEICARSKFPVFCYATSAVRDSENGDQFIQTISERKRISAEIITGTDEALYARIGAGVEDGGLIDIGGGSFQISTPEFSVSFPLGCIRAKDICSAEETLSVLEEKLTPEIQSYLGTLPPFPLLLWKAVGGSATTLACLMYDFYGEYSPRITNSAITNTNNLFTVLQKIDRIPVEQRRLLPLLKSRADVILGGGFILHKIMQGIGIPEIGFSDKDGLEGYALHILETLI